MGESGVVLGDGDGISVGGADRGVGSRVVGDKLGLEVGTVEGNELGDVVGIVEGAGVVGDGVLRGEGERVGEGVGIQVVQSSVSVVSIPPATKPFPGSNTVQTSEPTGGVCPHLPVLSVNLAYP